MEHIYFYLIGEQKYALCAKCLKTIAKSIRGKIQPISAYNRAKICDHCRRKGN